MTTTSSSNSEQLARRVRTVMMISAASALAAVIASMVSIPSMRVLGPADRGEVATILQFVYIVALFVGSGTDRFLLRCDDYNHDLIPSGFAMAVAVLIACAIAGVVCGPWTVMTSVVTLATMSFSVVHAMAISRHRVSFFVAVLIGFQGLILLTSTVLYFAGVEDWRWWVTAYIFPALPLVIWSLAKSCKHTDSRVGGVIETTRTNAPFITPGLGPLMATCLGRVPLPALALPVSLGLFVIVTTVTEPLYRITQSVANQHTNDQKDHELTPSHVLRHLGIVIATYGALGASGGVTLYFLITPVFGHELEPTRELVLPLTIAAAMFGCCRHLCDETLGSDNPRRIDRAELISAVVVVICYPIGILLGDTLGLTWTNAIAYSVATIVAAVALMQPNGGPRNLSTTSEGLPINVTEGS